MGKTYTVSRQTKSELLGKIKTGKILEEDIVNFDEEYNIVLTRGIHFSEEENKESGIIISSSHYPSMTLKGLRTMYLDATDPPRIIKGVVYEATPRGCFFRQPRKGDGDEVVILIREAFRYQFPQTIRGKYFKIKFAPTNYPFKDFILSLRQETQLNIYFDNKDDIVAEYDF